MGPGIGVQHLACGAGVSEDVVDGEQPEHTVCAGLMVRAEQPGHDQRGRIDHYVRVEGLPGDFDTGGVLGGIGVSGGDDVDASVEDHLGIHPSYSCGQDAQGQLTEHDLAGEFASGLLLLRCGADEAAHHVEHFDGVLRDRDGRQPATVGPPAGELRHRGVELVQQLVGQRVLGRAGADNGRDRGGADRLGVGELPHDPQTAPDGVLPRCILAVDLHPGERVVSRDRFERRLMLLVGAPGGRVVRPDQQQAHQRPSGCCVIRLGRERRPQQLTTSQEVAVIESQLRTHALSVRQVGPVGRCRREQLPDLHSGGGAVAATDKRGGRGQAELRIVKVPRGGAKRVNLRRQVSGLPVGAGQRHRRGERHRSEAAQGRDRLVLAALSEVGDRPDLPALVRYLRLISSSPGSSTAPARARPASAVMRS